MKIERIKVGLNIGGKKLDVGELIQDRKEIHFKYLASFIETGLNISPIKLPFNTEVQTASPKLFDGVFGVFNDSLPDGWGKLLLDRTLSTHGINPFDISPLERLAYVGKTGYEPEIEQNTEIQHPLNLDLLANETMQFCKAQAQPSLKSSTNWEVHQAVHGQKLMWVIILAPTNSFLEKANYPMATNISLSNSQLKTTFQILHK